MPRNSSGVMSLPAGNPVIPGTLIESTWANPTMTDIANEITGSLPRNGAAPMIGPLMLARDGILPKEAVTLDQLNGAVAGSNNYLPSGAIQYFAMVAIPTGWLEANGAAVSRTTYANLFATIGTVFGAGNGTTTFNLPDLRGTFIRGFDDGRSLDPGRVFGSQQAGSNAAHNHSITDPGHAHTASQTAHSHSIIDPGHSHQIDLGTGGGATLRAGANVGSDYPDVSTQSAGTGVSLQSSQPTISVASSFSGISTAPSGGEARPVNVALVACIKAFGALQTDGLGTMAFQNKDAVNVTGGVGVFSSLQCTKVPTDPNDVARLADVGGVDVIYSSDIQTVVVDSTNPLIPIIRPQTNVPNGLVKLNSAGQIPTSLISVSDINYQGPWDASTGNTPSQEYPLVTFGDGDTYQISISGNLTLYGPDGTASPTSCVVGSSITYVTGSPTFPSSGWYYNPPVSFSGAAASGISFTPVGGISATNVQAMGAELDSEKAPKTSPSFTGILETEQAVNVTEPYGSLQVLGAEVMRFGGAGGDNSGQLAGFRNILINSSFQINNGNAGAPYVSGAVLAAGQTGHECWKAGASGGDYTFTQNAAITEITIASGKSLIQVIENKFVIGGTYILSWTGTAKARIGLDSVTPSGAYATSPILILGQNAGYAISVEFTNDGSGGTLSKPQLECSSIATAYEFRQDELQRTQRYFTWNGGVDDAVFTIFNSSTLVGSYKFPVTMFAVPVITIYAGTTPNGVYEVAGVIRSVAAAALPSSSGFGAIQGTFTTSSCQFNVMAKARI